MEKLYSIKDIYKMFNIKSIDLLRSHRSPYYYGRIVTPDFIQKGIIWVPEALLYEAREHKLLFAINYYGDPSWPHFSVASSINK